MKTETIKLLAGYKLLGDQEKEELMRSIVDKPTYDSSKHHEYDPDSLKLRKVGEVPVNTERGFRKYSYKDMYNKEFSIQKSSLATDDAIWFGISDAEPIIMASQAARFGVKTSEKHGWVPYPIPSEVQISTRMHLNREQVLQLLPILINFVETGELQ